MLCPSLPDSKAYRTLSQLLLVEMKGTWPKAKLPVAYLEDFRFLYLHLFTSGCYEVLCSKLSNHLAYIYHSYWYAVKLNLSI
jgi:hypothetical protein